MGQNRAFPLSSRRVIHINRGVLAAVIVLVLATGPLWPTVFVEAPTPGAAPSDTPPGAETIVSGFDIGFPGLRPGRLGLLLGGDVLLDLEPGKIMAQKGPLAVLPGWLELSRREDVELAIANLECAISTRGEPLVEKKFTFRADPSTALPCLAAGFDIVSVANNHVLDFGLDAFNDTLDGLWRYGILYAGAGPDLAAAVKPVFVERNGVKMAFLAFGGQQYVPSSMAAFWTAGPNKPGIAPLYGPVTASIRAAKEQADLVVVSFHWGDEYSDVIPGQRLLGKAAIDAGADLVFGHHPHIPQPVEIYKGKPILYSMGNLVFHPFRVAARGMLAAVVQFARGEDGTMHLDELLLFPLYNDGGVTVPMPAAQAGAFLRNLSEASAAYGTRFTHEDGFVRLVMP